MQTAQPSLRSLRLCVGNFEEIKTTEYAEECTELRGVLDYALPSVKLRVSKLSVLRVKNIERSGIGVTDTFRNISRGERGVRKGEEKFASRTAVSAFFAPLRGEF